MEIKTNINQFPIIREVGKFVMFLPTVNDKHCHYSLGVVPSFLVGTQLLNKCIYGSYSCNPPYNQLFNGLYFLQPNGLYFLQLAPILTKLAMSMTF